MESQISIAIRDVSRFRPLKGQSTRLDVFFDCARQLLRNYVISPFWAVVSFLAGLPLVKAIDLPASDNGDEFSNNLFSDLAPLLTLFGEQVSKQFRIGVKHRLCGGKTIFPVTFDQSTECA